LAALARGHGMGGQWPATRPCSLAAAHVRSNAGRGLQGGHATSPESQWLAALGGGECACMVCREALPLENLIFWNSSHPDAMPCTDTGDLESRRASAVHLKCPDVYSVTVTMATS
jgi:hypothetical protein